LVVVDKFTKLAHFMPLRHPYTAALVGRLFLDHVYKLHGLPVSIVSDRDKNSEVGITRSGIRMRVQGSNSRPPGSDNNLEGLY
jgi:hypothetical protein